MKSLRFAMPCLTALFFAAAFSSAASANCGTSNKSSGQRASNTSRHPIPAALIHPMKRSAADENLAPEPSVTGYWYVRWLADGMLVDDGFDLWSSDGLEFFNDSPAPFEGDVCMGVWTKTAPYTYVVKHPSWIFDQAGVNLLGVVVIREQITLAPDGLTFSGTSSEDAYDMSGNLLGHFEAELTGERVNALDDPSVANNPIPGLPASIVNRGATQQH